MPSYFFTIFAVLVAVGPGLAAGNDGTDQTCEGAMKPALTGWPGNNFWGDLEETPDPTREETGGNGGPLFLLAPSKEKTNVHKAITRMCATMCSLMYDANARGEADDDKLGETLFYDSIKMQAKHHEFPALVFDDKLKIFDDHGLIKSALAPMATAIVNDTMIIAWRGSVRTCPQPRPRYRAALNAPRPSHSQHSWIGRRTSAEHPFAQAPSPRGHRDSGFTRGTAPG